MKVKLTLSIGVAKCRQEEIIDVPDEDLAECQSDAERNEYLDNWLQSWANNYISMNWEEVDGE